MEAPSIFKFPAGKDAAPPLPRKHSIERVNNNVSRNTTASISSKSTKTSTDTDYEEYGVSPKTSPTRRAKIGLFGDYNSHTPTTSGFSLPQSPSLPEINALRSHARTNSDVQGLVKRFEHLDVRDRDAESTERRKRHEAELKRAHIAREEAESDVMRLREEVRRLKKEGEEGKERERKVAKRLEVLMEENSTAKESGTSQLGIYEKELRKARKEAFKSSSTIVKIQEELKAARQSLKVSQSGLDFERQKLQQKEQERFEMEYQLIPLQEHVEKLKQRLKVVESEKEALKTSLQKEEVARIAAEGMIALPTSQNLDEDLLSSPRKCLSPAKRILSPLSDDKENVPASISKKGLENRRLVEELEREKIRREHAEELADFLKMECMFQCCSCKTAARLGHEFALSLDAELASGLQRVKEGMEDIFAGNAMNTSEDWIETDPPKVQAETAAPEAPDTAMANHDDETFDRSITFAAESPKSYPSPNDQLLEEEERALQSNSPLPHQANAPEDNVSMEANDVVAPLPSGADTNAPDDNISMETKDIEPPRPSTPVRETQPTHLRNQPSIRTVTTTTTIPMQFTPKLAPVFHPTEDAENIPPPADDCAIDDSVPVTPSFDRAAALAAIEYRRGRAKSIANGHATPRKQMLEGVGGRRDISAPALGQQKAVAVSGVKAAPGSVKGRRG